MRGKLTGIVGPMFSGKTTTLMIEYDKSSRVGKPMIFKPQLDTRYANDSVVSHDKVSRPAINCSNASFLFGRINTEHDITDVLIDEVQFFDDTILDVIEYYLSRGVNVTYAGLAQDYRGLPFNFRESTKHVGELLCKSDDIKYLKAKCSVCGEEASRTHRKSGDSGTIVLGSDDKYDARCYKHKDAL